MALFSPCQIANPKQNKPLIAVKRATFTILPLFSTALRWGHYSALTGDFTDCLVPKSLKYFKANVL